MSLDPNRIHDLETLRELARVLSAENDRLHSRLAALAERVDRAEGRDAQTLQRELEGLKRELAKARSQHTGARSERRRPHRRNRKPKSEHKPQTGGKRTEQPELETQELALTLDEKDRTCPTCGDVANPLGGSGEVGELITVLEREFKLVTYQRHKYVRRCSCDGVGKVLTAPAPLKPTPKGRFSLDFAAQVAVDKYADQIPLTRQAKQMKRLGLVVQPNVLWSQVWHLSEHLRPTYEAVHAAAFDEPALGADETGWPMLEKGRKLWQVRCLTSPRLSYFRIVARKDTQSALELLTHPERGVFTGTLVTDGAQAYDAARRESKNAFELANCWSHARRYLLEAEPDYPQATAALDIITKLYLVEREALAVPESDRRDTTRRLRAEQSKPLTAELREWMNAAATKWDGSSLNVAIRYIDGRWRKLTRFLEQPDVPIHNNASEFALRRPVLGRKTYYGAKSRDGTQVAALCYSLLETARKAGVDPLRYLVTAAERAIRQPGTATLPWDLVNVTSV